jgi:signal transduction histidine kinase
MYVPNDPTPSTLSNSLGSAREATATNKWLTGACIATLGASLIAVLLIPEMVRRIFSGNFLPHSYCYLYDKRLIGLHVASDTAIWLAYVSISVTLAYTVYRTRREVPFSWMFLAFGTFIIACGFTHLMEVIVLWKPVYWLSGDVKLLTAVASVITAIALPPLVPRIRELVSASKTAREYQQKVEEANLELSRNNVTLKMLSARLLQIQDEERRRVAREVHDSAGQLVAALSINVDRLDHDLSDKEREQIRADTKSIVKNLGTELRTISHLLHPPLLDEVGLSCALQWYVEGFRQRCGIEAELKIDSNLRRLSSEMEIAVFRVVQECLTNVHRHSQASRATVSLFVINSSVRLEVSDNGEGISSVQPGSNGFPAIVGVGISGMRERVSQLGGQLAIKSSSAGTTVTANFPLDTPVLSSNQAPGAIERA